MLDFIDFGCGSGGSINWAKSKFGGETHLGLTNRANEVEKAIEEGYNVKFHDITDDSLELPQCRYIIMLHFLEHLENAQTVEKVIEKAIKTANEFVFIKVPFFDEIEYLKSFNFRLTWTNWKGHTTETTTKMFKEIFDKFSLQTHIGYSYPILDSQSKEVIPYLSAIDTLQYDETLGEKKFVEFKNIYRELYCYININCKDFDKLIKTNLM